MAKAKKSKAARIRELNAAGKRLNTIAKSIGCTRGYVTQVLWAERKAAKRKKELAKIKRAAKKAGSNVIALPWKKAA